MDSNALYVTVAEDAHGMRLDKYLATMCADALLTRQRIQQLIKDGNVTIEEHALTSPSAKVKSGQYICIQIPDVTPMELEAEDIPLDILYEDDALLVINKAAGMVVHPAPGAMSGTLVHALLHHCQDSLSGIGGVGRPGIVHRLDKDTSGLMLVAKHDAAHQHLAAQLQDRSLSRTYHACCWHAAQPPNGVVDAAIGRATHDRKRMAIREDGKQAITHYTTLKHYRPESGNQIAASLVECRLKTGRTHQIRVHMHHLNCPIMGDPVYGQSSKRRLAQKSLQLDPQLEEPLMQLQGQALHAKAIRFIHPTSETPMEFSCTYPEDMARLIAYLWPTSPENDRL